MAEFSFRWGIDLFDNQRTPIPNWILENYHRVEWQGVDDDGNPVSGVGISNTEMMFIIHLASFRYESEKGVACPSLTGTIAERMKYKSNQGIINVQDGLVNKGLLVVEKRPGKTSVYNFTPFSKAVLKAIKSSIKLDDHQSTKVDDLENDRSTEIDESRQEKLTQRKEQNENLIKEREEKKSAAQKPPPARDYLTDVFEGNMNGVREGERLICRADWNIYDPLCRQAIAAFLEASHLPIPVKPSTRKDWLSSIGVHVQTYGVDILEEAYPLIVAQMRRDSLTVSRPGSVTNNLADWWAKKNGGKHATHKRPDDETFFDPASGQLVRRDPATGQFVPVP